MTIQAGVGFSYLADYEKAVLEASDAAMGESGLVRADYAIFFCTSAHAGRMKEIAEGITRVTAASQVAGCTGYGVIAGSKEVEEATGLVVLVIASDRIKGKSFFISPVGGSERLLAEKIVQESRIGGGPESVGILFPDLTPAHPDALLASLKEQAPYDLWIGGCPSSDNMSQAPVEAANLQAGSKAVSGLFLSGSFHPYVGVAQGAIPVGKTYTITLAKENVILELDGKKAYESLVELAESTKLPHLQDSHASIFLALAPGQSTGPILKEGYFVRNILGVDPQKGMIAVAAYVQEGQKVSFALRDSGLAKNDLGNLVRRIKNDLPGPVRFGLYFNCCARGKSLYGAAGVDSSVITEELGNFPLAGFFTNGEIGPTLGSSLLHNFSGVLFLACD